MKFNKNIKIGNKEILKESASFIIAEAGVNHGGDINIAKRLIDLASEAEADAVKFQTFKSEHLILDSVRKAPYQEKTTNSNESQIEMLKKLEVTKEQNLELKNYSEKKGIIFLTTPFDELSLDELDELNLPAYKIASTDITNLPFLKKVALKNKPIFLSTGMSFLSEVKMALETIYKYNKDVVLMQCTANYPIEDSEANLEVLNTFKNNFDILLGYSDHTQGLGAAAFAIPMGAKVVEKHFTLNKALEGPDHKASLSPDELKEFVRLVRKVDSFMGSDIKKPTLSETKTRASLQKCLVAKLEIKKGELFTENNIIAKRTGGVGISPIYFNEIVGKKAKEDFVKDEIISL
ncbi:N-acetylneuraminate synthase [Arcobacter arenosus]|uniref:N-acetylneuraminate synthase n=1 Tax=Arcobacter arenosus TaxID=2576037 RepID=A0A5R8Y186_9BACT|nr:N-acetylneuraminate synthase [Arcobacter arenosus]TLP38527.1 N-acetylneuraminate synthase [Arcobacter arenosus]